MKQLRALPDDLRSRVAVVDGVLYISDEHRGKLEIVNLVMELHDHGIRERTMPAMPRVPAWATPIFSKWPLT